MATDYASIVGDTGNTQYADRLTTLRNSKIDPSEIESAVNEAIANFAAGVKSFVIFGEPQSGKTEMMIALNASLLDAGCEVIINLLNDSVDLLNQSLARFRMAGLNPSPKQFLELPTDGSKMRGKKWVIFAKKNAKDLQKLKETLRFVKSLVVIDDEADYASPNAKVNKQNERTKINQLIWDLIKERGSYIGVTATPARLDLNNTFSNVTEKWVNFAPHKEYVGQDFFFPNDGQVGYRLFQFKADEGNERTKLREAVFHFLCGVAQQHALGNARNFSMIVHTSGKKIEHTEDVAIIEDAIDILSSPTSKTSKFNSYVRKLEEIAADYGDDKVEIVKWVLQRISQHQVVTVNSNPKANSATEGLVKPSSLFSFGAGGNIISRGLTFDNLLSMYFTRSVKGKFTQDTYIQRARMFGSRKKYKSAFQLWIPTTLMENWSKCFYFHKLAVEAIKSGKGAPVWLSDHKSAPTSAASIDRSTVDFEDGEMSFGIFDFELNDYETWEASIAGKTDLDVLDALSARLGDCFPSYVKEFLRNDIANRRQRLSLHSPAQFGLKSKTYTAEEIREIRRKKGMFSTNEFQRGPVPNARHHLKIFYNEFGKARLLYKINGTAVRFMQNTR